MDSIGLFLGIPCQIVNAETGFAIHLADGSPDPGTPVNLEPADIFNKNQIWRIDLFAADGDPEVVTIRNVATNTYLQASDPAPDAPIIAGPPGPSQASCWRMQSRGDGTFAFVSFNSSDLVLGEQHGPPSGLLSSQKRGVGNGNPLQGWKIQLP